jgi:hypothetical protein
MTEKSGLPAAEMSARHRATVHIDLVTIEVEVEVADELLRHHEKGLGVRVRDRSGGRKNKRAFPHHRY